MTTIKDKITYYDGSVATGKIVVTWPPFDYGGTAIAAGQQEYPIAPDGTVVIDCYPCVGAQPIGTYYTATYELDKGATYDEYWLVPSAATTTIGAIRVSVPATPSIMINAQQLTSSGAQSGMFLGWSGSGWVPMYPSSFNCAVRSFFGRTGDVMPLTGDYTVAQVTNAVPDARRVIAGSGLSGGGPLTADVTISLSAGGFVPPTRQILAGYGLTGGGPLSADVTLSVVTGMFALQTTRVIAGAGLSGGGPLTGDVTLSIPAGTTVPPTTQVIAGFGLTGGGPLSGNVTLSVLNNASVQKLQLALAGALKATRHQLNFVAGSGVNINLVDDGPNDQGTLTITAVSTGAPSPSIFSVNGVQIGSQVELNLIASTGVTLAGVNNNGAGRVDVTVSAAAGGGQTPWLTDIDGGGHSLTNVNQISGTGVCTMNEHWAVNTPNSAHYAASGYLLYVSSKLRWNVQSSATESGSNSGSDYSLYRYDDGGTFLGNPFSIARATGNVTLGDSGGAQALSQLQVCGDISLLPNKTTTAGAPIGSSIYLGEATFTSAGYYNSVPGLSSVYNATTTNAADLAFYVYNNQSNARLEVMRCYRASAGVARLGIGVTAPAFKLDVAGDCNLSSGSVYRINGVPLAAASVGAVPVTRQVIAGAGLTGGGALSADVTLAAKAMAASGASHSAGMVPDPGATAGATKFLREDATWAVVSAGASQTPWTQDIDGAGFRLINTGNVGIGTTSPQALLQIGGSAATGYPTYRGSLIISEYSASLNAAMGLEFHTRGDSGGYGWRMSSLANNVDLVFESRFGSATWTERMRILNNGNVGIGTTSPQALLETSRPHDTGWNLRLSCTGLGGANQNVGMDFYDIQNANQMAVIEAGSETSFGANLQFWTKPPTGSAGVCSEKMRITAVGNVGIGTTSPQATLDIKGAQANALRVADGNDPTNYYAVGRLGADGYLVFNGVQAVNSGYRFRVSNGTEIVSFMNSGNVGIGTTSPQSLLMISGPQQSSAGAATQIRITEPSGNVAYGMSIGVYADTAWKGVIQAGSASTALLLNPNGGNVGIGTTTPSASMHLARGDGSYQLKLLANGIREYGLAVTGAGFLTIDDLTGGVVRMLFDPNGNIGIGGPPGYKLDVAGDVNCSGAFRVNGAPLSWSHTSPCTSTVSLGGLADLPNMTITVPYPGAYLVIASCQFLNTADVSNLGRFYLNVGGAQQSAVGDFGSGSTGGGSQATITCHWVINVSAGTVVKVQAARLSGSGVQITTASVISIVWIYPG